MFFCVLLGQFSSHINQQYPCSTVQGSRFSTGIPQNWILPTNSPCTFVHSHSRSHRHGSTASATRHSREFAHEFLRSNHCQKIVRSAEFKDCHSTKAQAWTHGRSRCAGERHGKGRGYGGEEHHRLLCHAERSGGDHRTPRYLALSSIDEGTGCFVGTSHCRGQFTYQALSCGVVPFPAHGCTPFVSCGENMRHCRHGGL